MKSFFKRTSALLLTLSGAAVYLTLLASTSTAAGEPIYNPSNGHYYEAVAGNITWPQARAAAAARTYKGVKGHLITVTTAAENQFVIDRFGSESNSQYLMGGEQAPGSEEPGGGWRWITGEPWGYSNWNIGEPNNTDDSNRLAFADGGNSAWNDVYDTAALPGYIVEYDTTAPEPQKPLEFTDPVLVGTDNRGAGFPVPADMDRDGHLDLVLSAGIGIEVLHGRGNGTFDAPIYHPVVEGETYGTHVADLNNDGKLDVMLVCSGQNKVALLFNTGGRTLAKPTFVSVGTRPFGVDAVDLNEDGWLDLVVTNHEDHNFSTLMNLKNGTFGPRTTYGAGSYTSLPTHGDYNRDGHQDVVIPNYVPGNYNIYFGDGSGSFSSGFNEQLPSNVPQMATDDVNRDGILDLVSANMYDNSVTILTGDGDGHFSQRNTYGAGQYPHVLRTGDLDGDGAPEVIVPNAGTGYITILRNDGKGFFTATDPYFMVGGDARYAAVADYNEDGRPDILTTSNADSQIGIRFNLTGPARIAAPDALTAKVYSPQRVELSWTDRSSNENGFKVYRRLKGATNFQLIATLARNVVLYREGPLNFGQYEYVVRAYVGDNLSLNSNIASVTIPKLPNAPLSFTATANPNAPGVTLSWRDSKNNPVERYQVWRRTGAAGSPSRRGEVEADGTQPVNTYSFTDSSVAPNTAYTYFLRSLNSTGSIDSAPIAVTTSGPPSAPTNLAATAVAGQRRVNLTWKENASNEQAVEVWRSVGAGAYALRITLGTNVASFADTEVEVGTTYRYFVLARNGWGASARSNTVQATTDAPPAVPTNLTARAADLALRVNLAWRDTANETGYEVWRKEGPADSANAYARRATLAANATSYADTVNLVPGGVYTYYLIAVNAVGSSAPSSTATATLDNKPNAPQGLTAQTVAQTLRVNLAWQDVGRETGYEVWRKEGAGAYARRATLPANTRNYADTTGLSAGATYSYYVVAVNPLGISDPSNLATATLDAAPSAPQGLTVRPVKKKKRLTLHWQDATGESSYEIWRKPGAVAAAGTYVKLTTVGANVVQYVDTKVQWKKRYSYYVVAVNPLGNAQSNKAEARVSKKP